MRGRFDIHRVDLCVVPGNRLGQAGALNNLGTMLWLTDDYPGATEALQQALDLHRELGDRGGEVEALNEYGALCRVRGDLTEAAVKRPRSRANSPTSTPRGVRWGNPQRTPTRALWPN